MPNHREVLERLARETGRLLGELGLSPDDTRWIEAHAEIIATLAGAKLRRRVAEVLYRLARRAARAAR